MRQSIGSRMIAGALFVVALLSIGTPVVFAEKPSFPSYTHEQMWNILSAEIVRDRELTSHGINRARMRQVQDRLAPDIEPKEMFLEEIAGVSIPLLKKIRALLAETLADEKRIVEGGGTHRYRRFAERALGENLKKKEGALAELEKAIR